MLEPTGFTHAVVLLLDSCNVPVFGLGWVCVSVGIVIALPSSAADSESEVSANSLSRFCPVCVCVCVHACACACVQGSVNLQLVSGAIQLRTWITSEILADVVSIGDRGLTEGEKEGEGGLEGGERTFHWFQTEEDITE